MAIILLFDANNEARLIKRKVKDGCVSIEGKQFLVDESEPILLRGKTGGYKPMYIVKWDMIEPSSNMNPKTGFRMMNNPNPRFTTKKVTPEFNDNYQGMTPELFKKMMGMKILGNMIKTKREMPNLLMMVLSVVAGIMIMLSLMIFKII